jgi:hypothetical protein
MGKLFIDTGIFSIHFFTEQNTHALYAVAIAANKHVKITPHTDSSLSELQTPDSESGFKTFVTYYVGVVFMKISIFWDTPCSPLKVIRRFR